jgi:MoxR-like ATPase
MTTAPTKTNRSRIRRSPAQWRALFARFKQDEQTREQFCIEQGISLSSFDRWRTKLHKAPLAQAVIPEGPMFVELTPETPSPVTSAWDVELQLGAGVFLRLRRPC